MSATDATQLPEVTVVVSCYNHARYIEACIESIVDQTYSAIELLVYDDGSTDDSPKILKALADKHGFSFTAQKNRGLSATLNDALHKAKGKYFCPVGSDDILMLDKTRKQVAFLEANPDAAICAGNALFIDGEGLLLNKRQRFHPARDLSFEELFENTTPGFISPTAMIRTESLREVGGYRADIPLEDLYLWLKLAHTGHRLHVMNDIVLYYRKHNSNTYKNISFMFDSISRTLAEYRDHPRYPRVIADEYSSLFLAAAKQRQRKLALSILGHLSPAHYNRKIWRGLGRLLLP